MEEVEKDVSDSQVLDKYKIAAEISNNVMNEVINFIQPGQNVADVCVYGDKTIIEHCSKKFQKLKNKGIAWPTCISVNHCAGHFSPLPEDPAVILKAGDVVKIDLGVHIDGWISQCAHTIVLGHDPEVPITGKVADAFCAAYFISECIHRLLKPGKTNTAITNTIQKVCDAFHVSPLDGVLSHEVSQNLVDGNGVIINKASVESNVEEFAFEMNKVYVIDVVVSTGQGKTKEVDNRTTVFKRAIDRNYQLKLDTSRAIFKEINTKSPMLPFNLRWLDEKKRRMGIVEIIKHDLVDCYPVLWEKEGEIVVQFKWTALILPTGTQRMNNFALPLVTSEYSIDNDTELQAILAASTKTKKKKNKGKGKKGGAAAAQKMDVEEEEEDE